MEARLPALPAHVTTPFSNPPTTSERLWVIEHWAPWLDPLRPPFAGLGDWCMLKDELLTRCAEPGYRRVERKKKETTMQNRFRASVIGIVAVAAAVGIVISAPIAWAQAQKPAVSAPGAPWRAWSEWPISYQP